jgi:bacterioferritin-associated ferredoxin
LYICNCNGLRQRDARAAIEAGASRPAHIFRHHGCSAQCAKCVCDMRRMIDAARSDAGTVEVAGAPSRRLG